MHIYKLMVVSPFENYKRGDYIYDQELISKILDKHELMNHYESKVRKMLLSDKEKMIYLAPEKVVVPLVNDDVKPAEITIKSIKDDDKRMNKSSKS